MLLDAHCHVDHYEDPFHVLEEASRRDVFIVAVTKMPSHFAQGRPHLLKYSMARGALGLHPLEAMCHGNEIPLFRQLLEDVTFIGEIGLDGSREGWQSMEVQEQTFCRVLEMVADAKDPKILSIHSRRAEKRVFELLVKNQIRKAVFHWYSGPLGLIESILEAGYFFSVNPGMLATPHGNKVVSRIPTDRILTETDGPFAGANAKPFMPWDVESVLATIAEAREHTVKQMQDIVWRNFRRLTLSVPERRPS